MNRFAQTVLSMALAVAALSGQAETKTTYRDAQGRVQGYKQTR